MAANATFPGQVEQDVLEVLVSFDWTAGQAGNVLVSQDLLEVLVPYPGAGSVLGLDALVQQDVLEVLVPLPPPAAPVQVSQDVVEVLFSPAYKQPGTGQSSWAHL